MNIKVVNVKNISKSKVPHVCDCCDNEIEKGSQYIRGYASINNLSFEFFVCKDCELKAISSFNGCEYVDNNILFKAYRKKYKDREDRVDDVMEKMG